MPTYSITRSKTKERNQKKKKNKAGKDKKKKKNTHTLDVAKYECVVASATSALPADVSCSCWFTKAAMDASFVCNNAINAFDCASVKPVKSNESVDPDAPPEMPEISTLSTPNMLPTSKWLAALVF